MCARVPPAGLVRFRGNSCFISKVVSRGTAPNALRSMQAVRQPVAELAIAALRSAIPAGVQTSSDARSLSQAGSALPMATGSALPMATANVQLVRGTHDNDVGSEAFELAAYHPPLSSATPAPVSMQPPTHSEASQDREESPTLVTRAPCDDIRVRDDGRLYGVWQNVRPPFLQRL